ncbi:MAG: c-type cytochrome [Nitrospirae bacterium]|nr:c-type cytochrome [Nitrospirota bacterium]
MKKMFALLIFIAIPVLVFAMAGVSNGEGSKGEALFKQHCAMCHPNGSNIVNPAMTLQKKTREANGVKTAADIVGKMRNPGPGMTKFDAKTLPDKDANEIAQYILKTFK